MKKVLVIDDSKTIRTLCEWIYKGMDDRLLTADSAAAGRSIIQKEHPEVVFVDYTLPDMDAYEFVSSIKSQASVIMLGGQYAPFSEEQALQAGAVSVLMKPFKAEAFYAAADAACAQAPAAEAADAVAEAPAEPEVKESLPEPPKEIQTNALPPIKPIAMGGLAKPTDFASTKLPPTPGKTVPHIAPISAPRQAPPPARFNFPASAGASITSSTSATVTNQPAIQGGTPAAPMPAEKRSFSATPKTPVPSLSPAVAEAQAQAQAPQVDPALIRAEVIAAVKSLLPAIVNSYLKKLIQAEVKPQLQNWVDSRVDALVKKMMQQ
ncbi:MAG: response regulator [Proteobacteria bacterium]|nr:response regulator [Pseudomonadota bacterium]